MEKLAVQTVAHLARDLRDLTDESFAGIAITKYGVHIPVINSKEYAKKAYNKDDENSNLSSLSYIKNSKSAM